MLLVPRANMPYQVAASAWNGEPAPERHRAGSCSATRTSDGMSGTRSAPSATSTARTGPSRFLSRSTRLGRVRTDVLPARGRRRAAARVHEIAQPATGRLTTCSTSSEGARHSGRARRRAAARSGRAGALRRALGARPGGLRDGSVAAGGGHRRGGVRCDPAPLTAPARFNLVGLRWRGRAEPRVARARPPRRPAAGRAGSAWRRTPTTTRTAGRGERPVAASDPVWVGEADQVQYRMSRRVPGLRIHFVNVKGTATAGDRLRTAMRHVANTRGEHARRRAPAATRRMRRRRCRAADRPPPRLGREQVPAARPARVRRR